MLILALRTDKPQAEIGLYQDGSPIAQVTWEAHRQLAETLHTQIQAMLKNHNKTWGDVQGIACYQGPGSFTGLRIGLSVANALAASLEIPIAGVVGEQWLETSVGLLLQGKNQQVVLPEYGAPVHITQPRK